MQISLDEKPMVRAAAALAQLHHRGVKRKYTGEEYIQHPIRVAERLLGYNITQDKILAAALLHDCLEDANVFGDMMNIRQIVEIDPIVARWVDLLTCKPGGNRAGRKDRYNKQLFSSPVAVKSIKCADIIDNVHGIVALDPKFAPIYLAEKQTQLAVLRMDTDPAHTAVWLAANTVVLEELGELASLERVTLAERRRQREADYAESVAEIEQSAIKALREGAMF